MLIPLRQLRPIVVALLLSGLPLTMAVAAPATPAKATPAPASASSNTAKPRSASTAPPNRPMTAQQYIQQQYELRQEVKKMQLQVDQISEAHQTAIAQNQALQLANDSLSVQVKVLQSEQSAQMFLYGAATISIGGILGLVLGHVMGRRQRRW